MSSTNLELSDVEQWRQRAERAEAEVAMLFTLLETAEALSNEIECVMWDRAKHEESQLPKTILNLNTQLQKVIEPILKRGTNHRSAQVQAVLSAAVALRTAWETVDLEGRRECYFALCDAVDALQAQDGTKPDENLSEQKGE